MPIASIEKRRIFQFTAINRLSWVAHGISTRDWGDVKQNRKDFFEVFGLKNSQVVDLKQVHGNHVYVATKKDKGKTIIDRDAVITKEPRLALFIKSADCVPILLVDKKTPAIAAIHAGWRGTVQEISRLTVEHMQDHFGTNPKNIIACLGPCIGSCCYEVDAPVISSFFYQFSKDAANWMKKVKGDHAMLDLKKANKFQLIKTGILENNIEVASYCTFDHNNIFFSERKENKTGRFGTFVMML